MGVIFMGYFRDNIQKVEDINKDQVRIWVNSSGWLVNRDDTESFCDHMDDWYSICSCELTRKDFEEACISRGIDLISDDNIGGYAESYGDFGMSHYHTVPENRKSAITNTLIQRRWFTMQRENPNIIKERNEAEYKRREALRIEGLRKTYPEDLDAWIASVGGLEAIFSKASEIHQNNSHQLREEGRHFEWLIAHTTLNLCVENKIEVPKWWGSWSEIDEFHPINRIAVMLADRRIEPYKGKITYIGYGEDCGDDVRQNFEEWL